MLFALLFSSSVNAAVGDLGVTFLPSGVAAKVDFYETFQSEFVSESKLRHRPVGLINPHYGTLQVVGKSFQYILDERPGKPSRLFVDTYGRGDLTGVRGVELKPQTLGGTTKFVGFVRVDIGKGVPVSLGVYRFDPKDTLRAYGKNRLSYYLDYGYKLKFKLDSKRFTTYVSGEPTDHTMLNVDRNGDGQISQRYEIMSVGSPFNFTGTTYQFSLSGGQLRLDKAKIKLPLTPMPPDVAIGKKALPFKATTLDGKLVEFPKSYRGKIVMLDFWATWCRPCLAELPNVIPAYKKWHDKGFEILGVSLDDKDMAETLKSFTAERGMVWSEIYEGKGWSTSLCDTYDVSGVPFVLLVDGDSGEILGNEATLRGPGLSQFVGKQLARKKSSLR